MVQPGRFPHRTKAVYKAAFTLWVLNPSSSSFLLTLYFRLSAMVANAALDASPPTSREGEPLKASPTPDNGNGRNDDVVCLGSRSLTSQAPSPDDNKGRAPGRKRGSSAL